MKFPQAGSYCPALSGPRGRFLEPHSHCGSLHAKRLLYQDPAWLTGEQDQDQRSQFQVEALFPVCIGFYGVSDIIFMWLKLLLMTNVEKNTAQIVLMDICLCAGFDPMISTVKINSVLIVVVCAHAG